MKRRIIVCDLPLISKAKCEFRVVVNIDVDDKDVCFCNDFYVNTYYPRCPFAKDAYFEIGQIK